jgi:hypothetical protein
MKTGFIVRILDQIDLVREVSKQLQLSFESARLLFCLINS